MSARERARPTACRGRLESPRRRARLAEDTRAQPLSIGRGQCECRPQTGHLAGTAEDIAYTNLSTGVHGYYLNPSIVAAGLDPTNLRRSRQDHLLVAGRTRGKIEEVACGAAAQLTTDYIEANGIKLPLRWRAFAAGANRRPVPNCLLWQST
jgi:hypothetical protein